MRPFFRFDRSMRSEYHYQMQYSRRSGVYSFNKVRGVILCRRTSDEEGID